MLLVTGWGRWLQHHYGLPPSTGRAQVLGKPQASTAPASLRTGVQHWSCQVILLYNPSKVRCSRWISQKFWQTHLGYADHYWCVSSLSQNYSSSHVWARPTDGSQVSQKVASTKIGNSFHFPGTTWYLLASQDGPTLQNTTLSKTPWLSRSQFRCQQ